MASTAPPASTMTAPTENAASDGGQRRDNSIACRRNWRSAAAARRRGCPAPRALRPRQQAHGRRLPGRGRLGESCRHDAARSSLPDQAHPEPGASYLPQNTGETPAIRFGEPSGAVMQAAAMPVSDRRARSPDDPQPTASRRCRASWPACGPAACASLPVRIARMLMRPGRDDRDGRPDHDSGGLAPSRLVSRSGPQARPGSRI